MPRMILKVRVKYKLSRCFTGKNSHYNGAECFDKLIVLLHYSILIFPVVDYSLVINRHLKWSTSQSNRISMLTRESFFLCDAVIAHILWDKKKRHPFSPVIQRAHVLFFAKHCTHVCLKNPSEQMSERSAPALLTLPIELVYRILNYLQSYDIFISAHNVCLKLNSIIDTYQPYQVSLSRHTSENILTHRLIYTS